MAVTTAVSVGVGTVNVTVVGVAAQTEQTVTVVWKPRGQPSWPVGQANDPVAEAGIVAVVVNGWCVKPLGPMYVYSVVQTVTV